MGLVTSMKLEEECARWPRSFNILFSNTFCTYSDLFKTYILSTSLVIDLFMSLFYWSGQFGSNNWTCNFLRTELYTRHLSVKTNCWRKRSSCCVIKNKEMSTIIRIIYIFYTRSFSEVLHIHNKIVRNNAIHLLDVSWFIQLIQFMQFSESKNSMQLIQLK